MKRALVLMLIVLQFIPSLTCSCTSALAPVSVAGACQPCRSDADCSSISGNPHCSSGVCRACNELINFGCSLASPYCSSGTCTSCGSNNLYCQMYDQNQGLSQISHVFCSSGLCSTTGCETSSDCLLPNYPICSGGTCQGPCSTNGDCSHISGYPYCISGKCRQCKTDADCTSGLCSASNDATQYNCVTCEPTTARGCTSTLTPFCVLGSPTYTYCTGCYQTSDCQNSENMIYQDQTVCNMNTGQCISSSYGVACSGNSCTSAGASYCYYWTAYSQYRCFTCLSNSNCGNIPGQPYCEGGSCVGCINNRDCETVALPRCDTNLYQCSNCLTNSDCSNYFPNLVCNSSNPILVADYQCVQCATNSDCQVQFTDGICSSNTCSGLLPCSTNSCDSLTFPQCDSNNYCRRCQADSDCSSKFASTPYCYMPGTGENVCVVCYSDSQCNNAEGYFCSSNKTCTQMSCTSQAQCTRSSVPECDTTTHICVQCTSDSQCKTWHGDVGYICTTSTGVCSLSPNACYNATSCTNPSLAFCNDGVCTPCGSNSNCSNFPTKPYCDYNTCVQCRTSSDCTNPSYPVCQSTNTCGGCQTSNDCTSFAPKTSCNIGTGVCQDCVSSHNCTFAKPVCQTSDGTCQPCTQNSECMVFDFYWACDTNPHTCVQCLVNNDCDPTITTMVCTSMTCTFSPTCTTDEDCTTNDFPQCDTFYGYCRRCTSDSDCDAQYPYGKCYQPSSGLNQCVQCLSDTDCSSYNNETCNLSTFLCTAPVCDQTYGNANCTTAVGKPNCVAIDCRACQNDSNCSQWYSDDLLKCNTVSGLCYVPTPLCTSWTDCNYYNMSNCANFWPMNENHCTGCNKTTECTRFPATPYCNTTGGLCVECLTNANCTDPSQSACNASYNCIPCSNNSQCSHLSSTPYCDTTNDGICRACLSSTNCASVSNARCDLTSYTCQPCINSSDCTHLASTPLCLNTISTCVQCLTNADCTSALKSQCVSNQCVPCTSDSDCTQISGYPDCRPAPTTNACSQCTNNADCSYLYTGGSCVVSSDQLVCQLNSPACTISSDCSSSTTYPICDTSAGRCRRCTSDSECPNGKPYCYPTTGASLCLQCRTGLDCSYGLVCYSGSCVAFTCSNAASCVAKDPTLPECDSNHKCVQCSNDTECQSWYSRTYGCNTTTGACFNAATPCTTDDDCPNAFLAKCGFSNTCTICNSDDDCTHISGGNNVCRTDLGGNCLQCMANIQCTNSSYPVCNTNGLCTTCTSNLDCSALFAAEGKPLCSSLTYGCVECISDCYCTNSSEPYCSITLDQECVQCLNPSDCPNSALPKCDSTGTCSACTTSSDCTPYQGPTNGLPYCNPSLGCVECIADMNCTTSPDTSCNVAQGVCVECISNPNCNDPTNSVCRNNVCVPCQDDSDCSLFVGLGLPRCSSSLGCVECLTDIECSSGSLNYCKINPGTCVQCLNNTQCTSSAQPVCQNNQCTTCSTSDDCSNFVTEELSQCSPSTHGCVECLSDSDCTNPSLPKCDSTSTCSACTTSSDCTAYQDPTNGLPYCNPSLGCVECIAHMNCTTSPNISCNVAQGVCVECISNSNCTDPTKSVCQNNVCVPCQDDSDCSLFAVSDLPRCSSSLGCVECLTNSDCSSGSLNYCNTNSGTCVQNQLQNCDTKGYYKSGSKCLPCDSSCLTCNGAAPTNCLTCPNSAYFLSSNQSCVICDTETVQAAAAVGTTSQVVFISATVPAVLAYLHSQGKNSHLTRILQIMARITYLKLIDVNYLTPLAKFYNYTDLGQFGLPNFFSKLKASANTSNDRILTQSTSNINTGSSNLFALDTEGNIIYNSYFSYSYGPIFLDGYGGIAFSSCVTFLLYLFFKLVTKCFKSESSKIKAFLIKLTQSFERSLIMTIVVSRYMYLWSSLIFNYAFYPLDGTYEQVSFGIAIFYTILLIFMFGIALCAGFYHSRESKFKLKYLRPLLNMLQVLLQEYSRKQFIGRFFPFWILFSNLMIILILLLLYKWRLVQLVFLTIISLTTITLSLPKKVFRTNANKILTIGTEVGFIMLSILFFAMYFLNNSGTSTAYKTLLALSWSAVVINISIILFQVIVPIAEFFRLRREKKKEEERKKAVQKMSQLKNTGNLIERTRLDIDNSQNSQLIQVQNRHNPELPFEQSEKERESILNRSRTRRTINIDDTNDSKLIQLQNNERIEHSFEQPTKERGISLNVDRKRRPDRTDSSLNKNDHPNDRIY